MEKYAYIKIKDLLKLSRLIEKILREYTGEIDLDLPEINDLDDMDLDKIF